MLGAIIGDIVGSRFEWDNIKSKKFKLFHSKCELTDDSIMTLAIANALVETKGKHRSIKRAAIREMQSWGRLYPNCSYGGRFATWLHSENPKPYGSYGNGAAMRVSGCAWAFDSMDKVLKAATEVTEVTHNHEEGIKGAKCVAAAIFLARCNLDKDGIKAYIEKNYYPLGFTLNEIRPTYSFDETCQGTVPQAIVAFLESKDFEDAIRNAISIGGDSDTLAAITGSIAEAYYGIPESLRDATLGYFDGRQLTTYLDFLLAFEKTRPFTSREISKNQRTVLHHADFLRTKAADQYTSKMMGLMLNQPEAGLEYWNDYQEASSGDIIVYTNDTEGIMKAFHSQVAFETAKRHPESSYDANAPWFTVGHDGALCAIHDGDELEECINVYEMGEWMADHPIWVSDELLDSSSDTVLDEVLDDYDFLKPVRFQIYPRIDPEIAEELEELEDDSAPYEPLPTNTEDETQNTFNQWFNSIMESDSKSRIP